MRWTYDLAEALNRGQILEEVRVRDLTRSPRALVVGVVNHRCVPLALVLRVGLGGAVELEHENRNKSQNTMTNVPLPLATARCLLALGVADSGGNPVTVFLIVPLLRLLSIWVRDGLGLIVQPTLGLLSLLIRNLVRGILVPVLGLNKTSQDLWRIK